MDTCLVFQKTARFKQKTAIIDKNGSFSYLLLENYANQLALLLQQKGVKKGGHIAFIFPPSFEYVVVLWAIWKCNGVAIPLCTNHPTEELKHTINDSKASFLIYDSSFFTKINTFMIDFIAYPDLTTTSNTTINLAIEKTSPALILYTSGTSGKPKGVVLTHENLSTTITDLVAAWKWKKNDHILHVLPLHHTHGIVNALLCALQTGATCEFLPKFDTKTVFSRFKAGKINVFMAVPTIYSKLIAYWNTLSLEEQEKTFTTLKSFRLMVSGSAALPISVLEKWQKISGHTLLERYGMTEIGMALSNPYEGKRKPGTVGIPLPNVLIRLTNEQGDVVAENESGEIQVKGKNVFHCYWNRSEETKASFSKDGWFKTGDSAIKIAGYYKILGRNSIDIIKTGGYKISGLEIEEVLRTHPQIEDCAVVGVPNEEWGEIVSVALISNTVITIENLKIWLADKLAHYKIPKQLIIIDELPKNILGKVTKKALLSYF